MPLCSICQRLTPAGANHCPHCGAAQRLTDLVTHAEDSRRNRARERRGSHALTGILLIAILLLVLGLPCSLFPSSLLLIAIQAVVIGGPLGWLVSAAGGGLLTGAAIGAGGGVVLAVVGGLFGSGPLLSAVLAGFGSGLVPGAIMGWHVEHDT